MSMASDFLPNLPGFKPHAVHKNGAKRQYMSSVNGLRFIKDDVPPELDMDLTSSSIMSLGSSSPKKGHFSSELRDVVLAFQVTFQDIHHTNLVRRGTLYFYPVDNSVKIIEHPQVNSGMPQGTVLRRTPMKRPDGQPFTIDDFMIGEEVEINKMHYYITDCSGSTRNYLNSLGYDIPESEKDMRAEMNRVTKSHRSRKNNLKQFMEAKLGNTVNNTGRQGFMNHGSETLKFLCVWDDSDNLYGDCSEYALVYHLCDDTIEIFTKNSKDNFPKLLRRALLPKTYGSTLLNDEAEPEYYRWEDIYIGAELNVFSRNIVILDADAKTRNFYAMHDMPLGEGRRLPVPEMVKFARDIPPHTGFGSEEDSLKSCFGPLNPTANTVRRVVDESRMLSFYGSLITDSPNDADRKFIISYYLQDGTLKIHEPPVRNSGYVGGLFLSRRKVKNAQGDYISPRDIRIGERLKVFTHEFMITGANQSTQRYLEEQEEK